MNNIYDCSVAQIIKREVTQHLLLYPEDYLYCESLEELDRYVKDDLLDSINCGDVYSEVLDSNFNIPEEFYEKWKSLKEYE